jgi:hypothetical protein
MPSDALQPEIFAIQRTESVCVVTTNRMPARFAEDKNKMASQFGLPGSFTLELQKYE